MQSANHSLHVSLVNQLLRNDDVMVTLEWPREAGAVHHVTVSPETSRTEAMSHDTFTINLTIPYNVQYNVTIVSSLCGVTTTEILNYGK